MKKLFAALLFFPLIALAGNIDNPPNLTYASGTLSITHGGTGATTASAARSGIGAAASGTNADITSLTGLTGGIVGVANASAACAGCVGEHIEAQIPVSAPVALTSSVITNVVNISLTPGNWLVCGMIGFTPSATANVTRWMGAQSTTSGGFSSDFTMVEDGWPGGSTPGAASTPRYSLPCETYALGVTSTVYLEAVAYFTVSTVGAFGSIAAIRIR